MFANKSYLVKEKGEEKRNMLDIIIAEDDKNYRQIAILNAFIVQDFSSSETFAKLLEKSDVQINYVIPARPIFKLDEPSYRSGHTILHIARELSETDICELLVQFGADFTMKNKDGVPLLCLENDDVVNCHYYFKTHNPATMKQFNNMVLSAQLQLKITDNPSDQNGLSHFHIACMYNKVELIQLFLGNGVSPNTAVNQDSPSYAGYTPLHFAVKFAAVETVELLLKHGADRHVKNLKGLDPLNLLIKEKLETWTQISRRLRTKADLREFCYSSLSNFHVKIENIILALLSNDNCKCGFDIYDDSALSYFHLICTMMDSSIVKEYLDSRDNINLEQVISTNSVCWAGYTPLHFAAHFNINTVKLLLARGANLGAKDATGITPFDICLNGMKVKTIYSIYSLYPAWADICFSDGKTKLSDFILAMQDNKHLEHFMSKHIDDANIFIPFDSPICAGYTPLHLNMICGEIPRNWNPENVDFDFSCKESLMHTMRVTTCMIQGANVCAEDARGSTPIHLAFKLKIIYMVFHLSCHEKIYNVVDEQGLTHLHASCAADCYRVVEKLLSDGIDVNEVTKRNYSYARHNASSGRDIDLYFAKGSTPLHIAAIIDSFRIVQLLINRNADVMAKDDGNLTALERCIGTSIFGNNRIPKWKLGYNSISNEKKLVLELLIIRVSDLIADTKSDQMLYCYSILHDEVLNRLFKIDHEPTRKILENAGITRLHVACFTKILDEVDYQLNSGADVNARINSTSPLWPGCTPLHILMKHHGYDWINGSEEHVVIANLLLERGADVTAIDSMDNTALHQIFQSYSSSNSNFIYVAMLVGHIKDFSVNPMNAKGLSHLHAACVVNNAPIVEKLLERGAEKVNQAVDYFDNYHGGFTALHFAAAYQSTETVDVLLRYGADIHWKNVFEETALHTAAREKRQPCVELLRKLIRAGADINARNAVGERPLEKLIKSDAFTNNEVKLFVEVGCRVNVWNPMTQEGCLAIALKKNKTLPIFKTMLGASDIQTTDEKGRNAIHNVVSFKRPAWMEFDENHIEEMFIPVNAYIAAIETLTKLDLNIDQQDHEGSTALHIAAQQQNITGIIALLTNGANINVVDSKGMPAFTYSLELSKLNENMEELDSQILKIAVAHMYKYKLIGHQLSQSNERTWQALSNMIPLEPSWFSGCYVELQEVKCSHIGVHSITLADFFLETGVISYYPSLLPGNRNKIDHIFRDRFDELRNAFPNFTGLLLMQHRKAVMRVDLIEPAQAAINFLVDFQMPHVCSDMIVKFLSNDALNNLIASVNV